MAATEHNTLTADTVDTVTLNPGNVDDLLVTNRSGNNPIYFRVDKTNPTIAGDDSYVVPASAGAAKRISISGSSVEVRLISAGAEDYSVEAR